MTWPTTPSLNDTYELGLRTWICVNASPIVWQQVRGSGLLAGASSFLQDVIAENIDALPTITEYD